MSPSMRPDGRPSSGVQNRFRHWSNRAHFRAVGAQRAALTPDVRSVASGQWRRQQSDGQSALPSTALDHASATERPPISPPRPWVSVDTAHLGQNASVLLSRRVRCEFPDLTSPLTKSASRQLLFIRNPQEARSARASATSYLREARSKTHDFKGKLPRAIVRLRVLAY